MGVGQAERTRAAFGLALLLGVFVMLASAIPLLPLLGLPLGFVAAGVAGAVPTLVLLLPRIGSARAALLAAAVACTLALGFLAVGFAAWLLSA